MTYQEMVDDWSDRMVEIAKQTGEPLGPLMLACDLAAAVLTKAHPDGEARLAALDVFLTRLGSVLDHEGVVIGKKQ